MKADKLLKPRATYNVETLELGGGLNIVRQEISKRQKDHSIFGYILEGNEIW